MIDAVFFDLDDTLHDDTATYRRAAERVADDVAAARACDARALVDAYVAQADAFWVGLTADALGTPLADLRERMWRAALRETGVDDADLARRCGVDYNRYRRASLALWPGVLDLLARLRRRGCKLGLITNGFAETHRDKILDLELGDAFDEVFIADEVGMLKPDVRLFRLAAQRVGVAPERCAMVGDRFDRDVVGAHAAGMFTIWMNVRGEVVPARGPQPDRIVTDVRDVEAALPPPSAA